MDIDHDIAPRGTPLATFTAVGERPIGRAGQARESVSGRRPCIMDNVWKRMFGHRIFFIASSMKRDGHL